MTDDRCERFEGVYAAHHRQVLRICRAMLRDDHAAEDATQEVFTRLLAVLDEVRDPGPWLRLVARNHCRDLLRRSRRAAVAALPPRDDTLGADPVREVLLRGAVRGARDALSSRERRALALHLGGAGIAEVARHLSLSYAAAAQLTSRARRAAVAEMRRLWTLLALGSVRWANGRPGRAVRRGRELMTANDGVAVAVALSLAGGGVGASLPVVPGAPPLEVAEPGPPSAAAPPAFRPVASVLTAGLRTGAPLPAGRTAMPAPPRPAPSATPSPTPGPLPGTGNCGAAGAATCNHVAEPVLIGTGGPENVTMSCTATSTVPTSQMTVDCYLLGKDGTRLAAPDVTVPGTAATTQATFSNIVRQPYQVCVTGAAAGQKLDRWLCSSDI